MRSLTSQLQSDLGMERKKIKEYMVVHKNQMSLSEYHYNESSQLAIKRVMNSIYGSTAAAYYASYLKFIASQITKKARNQIFSLYMYFYWYCEQRKLGDIVKILEDESKIKIEVLNGAATGHMKFVADNSLLKSLIDWEPKYNLDTGLRETYRKMCEMYR